MTGTFLASLLFTSALSAAGFQPVSSARARQALAVLAAPQAPDSLRPLRTLNPEDPMQRLMLAPLAQAIADAESRGVSPETAFADAAKHVEAVIEDTLKREDALYEEDPELLRYRLLRLRQLAPFYAEGRMEEVSAAAVRRGAKGRLAAQAVKVMRAGKKNLTPSMSDLLLVDNRHQLDVLAAMVERQNVTIADNMPHVLRVSTPLQSRAIISMLKGGRDIGPSIERLATLVVREKQVDMLEALIPVNGFKIMDNLDMILRTTNDLQVKAVTAMIANGRDLLLILGRLTTAVHNEHQLAALEALAKSRDADLDILLQTVLRFSNGLQVEALQLLLKQRVPKEIEPLARFYNTHQLRALELLLSKPKLFREGLLENAARATTSRSVDLLKSWMESVVLEPPMKTISYPAPPPAELGLIAAFFAAIAARFGWRRRAPAAPAPDHVPDPDGMREANRAWLNANPEVEAAVGRLIHPDFVAPYVELVAVAAPGADASLLTRARAALADKSPGWPAAQRREEVRLAIEAVENAPSPTARLMAEDRLRRLLSR